MVKCYKDISEPLSNFTINGDCFDFCGAINNRGYGKFSFKGKVFLAHRASYEKEFGKIPDGLMICHKCDNRKCINPGHLYAGTMSDNARDRYKGVTKKKLQNRKYDNDIGSLSFRIPKDLHQQILRKCIEKNKSIKSYILDLVNEDLLF